MMRKWTANKVILLTSIGLLILLGIVAVVSYSQYGKGLGYYLVLVLPFIAIVIGLLGLSTARWWIAVILATGIGFWYLYTISPVYDIGFLIPLIFCVILSIAVGVNSRKVSEQLKKHLDENNESHMR